MQQRLSPQDEQEFLALIDACVPVRRTRLEAPFRDGMMIPSLWLDLTNRPDIRDAARVSQHEPSAPRCRTGWRIVWNALTLVAVLQVSFDDPVSCAFDVALTVHHHPKILPVIAACPLLMVADAGAPHDWRLLLSHDPNPLQRSLNAYARIRRDQRRRPDEPDPPPSHAAERS